MNRTLHKHLRETVRALPRLAAIILLVGAPVLAVGTVNAAGDGPVASSLLVGGELNKPSGVGFVLAVTIQRNQ